MSHRIGSNTRMAALAGALLLMWPASPISGQVLLDDFGDGVRAPFWSTSLAGSGPAIVETNGHLEVTLPSDSQEGGGGFFGIDYFLNCRLVGDFDVQIDYELLEWPASNGGLVQFGVFFPAPEISFEIFRHSFLGEEYVSIIGVLGTEGRSNDFVNTQDLFGKLRLTRNGAIGTTYFLDNDTETWTQLFSGEVSTLDASVSPGASSNDTLFAGRTIAVAFDNFTVNEGNLSCEVQCGNGVLQGNEECDDANTAAGDGCDATCLIEPCSGCLGGGPPSCSPLVNGAPCDDDSACTSAGTCSSGACITEPPLDLGCRTATKNLLLIKDKDDDGKDKVIWKFGSGAATTQEEFGDPTSSATYTLCLHAGTTAAVIGEAEVPADAAKWKAVSTKGYKYKDRNASQGGIQTMLLKGSDQAKTKVLAKGKGTELPDPALPLDTPVIVRLLNSDTGICWESSFDEADIGKNEVGQFKAKQ